MPGRPKWSGPWRLTGDWWVRSFVGERGSGLRLGPRGCEKYVREDGAIDLSGVFPGFEFIEDEARHAR